jgi:4-hydroxy-tetrahydrodipicolinate synthase
MVQLTGTGVAMVTPFNHDGSVDFNSLKKLINHLTTGGVNYLVVLGTTGETATLELEEKQAIFTFVANNNPGNLPLVAGIGGNNTQAVINQFKTFNLTGYSAILSVAPYYNKPNQAGMLAHYTALNNATPLPIIMYNVPGRTGANITAATTLQIASSCNNIIATKEASGNLEQIMHILKYKPAGFEVISGDDNFTLPLLAMGSIGTISVVANAYPKIFAQMVQYGLANNFTAARPLHESLFDITNSMFEEGNPSGLKAYLEILGICKNTFRLPVVGVSNTLANKIKILASSL